MLSESEARAIQQVRELLADLQTLARRQGTQTNNAVETFAHGVFAETCHTAAHALFQVINVADTYLDDAHAEAVLKQ